MSDTCYGYHEHYKATGDTLVIPKMYTKKQTTALLFHIFYVAKWMINMCVWRKMFCFLDIFQASYTTTHIYTILYGGVYVV